MSTPDRLPPFSMECEQGVLGCALSDPATCMPVIIEKLRGEVQAFYDLRHQTICAELLQMFSDRESIDIITVHQRLADRQMLEQVGGVTYLSQLQDAVPSTANLPYYLNVVREKYVVRKLLKACTDIACRVYEFDGTSAELLDECERELMAINALRNDGRTLDTKSILNAAVNRIETLFNTKGQPSGLVTGFDDLDRMTDGLHPAEMIIIAARPSIGKSSLMMNIVEHTVLQTRLPVGVFSAEMSAESLMQRSIGSVGRVNVRRPWEMDEAAQARMLRATTSLSNAASRLTIDDTSGLSVLELRAKARRMVQQHGVKLIAIDYLQLLHGSSKKARDNRQVEISEISQGIKAMAKELNLPVIVLSQLNRELEKNKRKPRVSDLRESGSLEQDADVIGLLSQELDEDGDPIEIDSGVFSANLEIAKQRNGPTGNVKLTFFKIWTRFESAARVDPADTNYSTGHND